MSGNIGSAIGAKRMAAMQEYLSAVPGPFDTVEYRKMIEAREETIRAVVKRVSTVLELSTALDAGAGVGFFSRHCWTLEGAKRLLRGAARGGDSGGSAGFVDAAVGLSGEGNYSVFVQLGLPLVRAGGRWCIACGLY